MKYKRQARNHNVDLIVIQSLSDSGYRQQCLCQILATQRAPRFCFCSGRENHPVVHVKGLICSFLPGCRIKNAVCLSSFIKGDLSRSLILTQSIKSTIRKGIFEWQSSMFIFSVSRCYEHDTSRSIYYVTSQLQREPSGERIDGYHDPKPLRNATASICQLHQQISSPCDLHSLSFVNLSDVDIFCTGPF